MRTLYDFIYKQISESIATIAILDDIGKQATKDEKKERNDLIRSKQRHVFVIVLHSPASNRNVHQLIELNDHIHGD